MCILLVEDEPLIRQLMAEVLAEAGFAVCEAEDGERAASFIADPPAAFSLLVTDIHMPGRLDGFAVARLMRTHHPAVPVIYTTGRPDIVEDMGELGEKEALVPKPYAPSDLLKAAKRLLAADRESRSC